MGFGDRLRELRRQKQLSLRALAQAVGVDFSYLSKIENGKAGYLPAAETVRALAVALDADPIELLELAQKLPPEIEGIAATAQARKFLRRAQQIASPDDWDALLDLLEERQHVRTVNKRKQRKL